MRLKCIKLAGFKSFVDPTTVYFPTNMGAVVGPNGCGKSNIIDAVRWVMGESSAKNLRGESMTDVIFNGSNSRKPVGQASIELVFDNSDGSLKGEYAGYAEISIRRKVTREAQNQYFLNGTKCRRRDITDIFLGTGLGPRSYSIIEQGMISRLIEAKPDELRLFIEEAAGISKYKERRRETENRIRRTHENLARLTDLREELERQLGHLQRQAQAAEKYKEYKAEERQLKAQLLALRWQALDARSGDYQQRVANLEVAFEGLIADQRQAESAIETQRDLHARLGDEFNQVQGRFYSLGAEISRIEQALQFNRDRQQQLRNDLQQTEQAWQEAHSHLTQDQALQADLAGELAEIEPQLELLAAAEEDAGEQLQVAEQAMHDWQQAWDQFNHSSSAPRQQAEVEQSRIRHLEQALERLGERIRRLQDEAGGLSVGSLDEELESLAEQLAELDLRSEDDRQRLDELGEQLQLQRDTQTALGQEQDIRRNEQQRASGRLASLEALQQEALQHGQGVREWLQRHGLQDSLRLAECLQVQPGWESAVETVLAEDLQAICLTQLDQQIDSLQDFSRGRLRLVEQLQAGDSGGLADGSLLQQVSSTLDLSPWLAQVYTAADLPEALQRRHALRPGESLITADGHWLGRNWLRLRRGEEAGSGVLARRQQIIELQQQLEQAEQALADGEQKLQQQRQGISQLEQQREQLQHGLARLGREHGELKAQWSARQVRVEQVNARRQRIADDLQELQAQREQEQEQLAEARLLLQEALERMASDGEQRERLLGRRDQVRERLDQARQLARYNKEQAHQLALRAQSLRAQQGSAGQALERLQLQIERLAERREQLQMTLEDSQAPEEDQRLQLEELLEQRLAVEQQLAQARQAMEQADQQLREQEQRRTRAEQQAQQLRGQLDEQRLDLRDLQSRRQALEEQLLESGYDLHGVLDSLPAEASEAGWEQQLAQLDARIQRLGAINLAAIDEYQQQSERKRYLDAQNDDLVEALNTLEQVIRRIDRETRARFRETFDRINQGLQALFPRVFGGGNASLELTGDDLLDTGVAIMAQPPGKKNSTIHLLSGGEKALTAIALVFSIFQLNPAPFCMLDEVDAPLDDANVGRYARMVKEMSDRVQFIYITHNKIAMEMADQLLGVTMHEPGCSRLVTVNVEEAAALAAV
ncbi:chromosome segregation protein SMC [Halopseudomonas yangmingensis]|uniref:Chromosome partition protein Smc n=1 Tax=Halopseudomonas yangmingensis TaxID=1720063 RepID=A0A1I4NFR0_9GAMM|nr:chromosome segregation protein SMC [Halopseudomonas yangmingensis]SFM14147.1 condensin subunit Smc [Halopseudomonas yangmingensis]